MSNEIKQTAMQMAIAHYKKLSEGGSNQASVVAKFLEENFLETEKDQMIEFAQEVFRNRYNQIHQSLGNIADDIYNETYGGGEQ